jgi:hypothetical protein
MRRLLVPLGIAITLQGCAYHRLVVQRPIPADQTYHVVNSSAVGWNISEQQSVADRCPTSLLSEVRVRTSFWQSLGTVLTLGLYQPTRIEYRCSKDPSPPGEIEP